MELLKININRILRDRIGGWKGKLIPGVLIKGLERMIRQDELNETLEATYPAEGTAFAAALYDHFDIGLEVEGLDNIPDQGRFIFSCNHPLGGLDGIGMIKILGEKYGDDGVRVLVNDMLMHVAPLKQVFLPINKYGSQARESAVAVGRAFASDMQMVVFPAGLVSRLGKDGTIADLEWKKSFVQMAIKSKRDIIPVRFEGLNRARFYRTAYWRKKLGLKVNIEQTMLPAELCAARGNRFKIKFGKPISWQSLEKRHKEGESLPELAAYLRAETYKL